MQPSLLELQRSFRSALASAEADTIAPWIVANGLAVSARLAIYRNNSHTNLRKALRADYPVVERLVGCEFFNHAADAYIAESPSLSGDVGDYGVGFPDFLATFPSAASLPYLTDVARLERAWINAFLAAEVAPGDFSGLATILPERLGKLRFSVHPAIRLLASPYPVMTIWSVNQPDHVGDRLVSLDSGAEFVLLRRIGTEVELCALAPGEYAWLEALVSGSALAGAVEAAFATQPDFDLACCMQRHVFEGSFTSYTEEQAHEK